MHQQVAGKNKSGIEIKQNSTRAGGISRNCGDPNSGVYWDIICSPRLEQKQQQSRVPHYLRKFSSDLLRFRRSLWSKLWGSDPLASYSPEITTQYCASKLTHFCSRSKIKTVTKGFDARLADRPFLVFDSRSGTLALRVEYQSAQKSKNKNGRLASPASNPVDCSHCPRFGAVGKNGLD